MDSHTLVKEIKRLLKEKKRHIQLFAIFFSILIFVIQLAPIVTTQLSLKNAETESESATQKTENPAVFEMYIEYENGSVYTNTLLLEESLKTDKNIQAAEQATGVEISELLEVEALTDYPKTARDRGVLGASRNEASNIWIFSSKVGTEKENLAVLNFFFDLIESGEIDLLNNKGTFIISEPRVLTDDELSKPESLVTQNEQQATFSIKALAVSAVIAVVGGLVIAIFIQLFTAFFSKKINYAFNYYWNEDDVFVLLSADDKKALDHVVSLPTNSSKVILLQNQNGDLTFTDSSDMMVVNHIENLELDKQVDEFIVIVQPNQTDKSWYNEQREILKAYKRPLTILQINNEK